MSNPYKRLFSNFIYLSIIQGTNFLLPIIVMPHVIKEIGAEEFGVISIAQVTMVYFSTISDYGFNLTATRDIALHRNDSFRISKIFFLVIASKTVITILSFLVLMILVLAVPIFQSHFLLYVLAFAYVVGQTLLVSWFFQGMEKMQYITIITLLARSIFVLLVFLFIKQKEDGLFFLFFLGVGNILAGLISIYLAIRIFRLKFVLPAWADIVLEIKEGWQITVSNLSINTYLYANIFILRLFTNDLTVGYYSIAEKVFFAVRQILGIFSQVIYPRICQLSVKSQGQLRLFFNKIFSPFFIFICLFCGTTFIFAPFIIRIFLSSASDLAILLLRMLSFVPVIVCLNIPAYQILLAFNLKRSYSGVLSMGTVVNIVANLLLCSTLGVLGTAISIIITESFITIGLNQQLYKNKLLYLIRSKPL